MAGVLYIVATPIGNLDDISRRAIVTLQAVDLIAAEDTRHSRPLLNHLGVNTPMLSCHEHNETQRAAEIVTRLQAGDDVALISDAGTPLISDPGYRLVQAAHEAGIRVSPIPGASSIVAALSAAGLPTDRFYYAGFLGARAEECRVRLAALQDLACTLLLLESRHRIERLLTQIAEIFATQPVVVAKELSKLHEQFLRGRAADILLRLQTEPELLRGEFVVLIDNSARAEAACLNSDEIDVIRLLLAEVSVKTAVKIATRLTGKKKNEIYGMALQISNEMDPQTGP